MVGILRVNPSLWSNACWVAVHGILATALSLPSTILISQLAILIGSCGTAEESRAVALVGLWVPMALVTEAPFLIRGPYTARRLTWLLAGIVALGVLSFFFLFPFMLGITFSLCAPRGESVASACVAYTMPAALAIVGPVPGGAQWALARRAGKRALWFLLASTLGMLAFGFVYLLVLGRLLPPGSDMSIPSGVAALTFAIITVPALAMMRPQPSIVPS